MRTWLGYAAALIVGIGTPLFALWVARSTPVGSDPALAGLALVLGMGIIAGVLAAALPQHWLALGLIVSVPLGVLGTVMFVALANIGEFFWIWLAVALGAVVVSLLGAFLTARAKRA